MGTFVTPTGFVRPTLQEIKQALEGRFRAVFGADIDTAPEGPIGQIIGEMAYMLASGWEGLQEIYTAHDPSAATDSALDIVAALTGVDRIAAAFAVADLVLYTDTPLVGVSVAAGKQARRVRGGVPFSLRNAVTITPASARDIYLEVPGVTAGTAVTLFTSFGTYHFTATGTDPEFSVLQGIAALVAADTAWDGTAQAYRPADAPLDAQFTARKCLRLFHPTISFSTTTAAPWACPLVGAAGLGDCTIGGPETAEAGEISEIATPVTGWAKVYNLLAASPGRNTETDDELRIRRAQTFRTGYATENAIRQAILNNVLGVISCSVKSNRTAFADADGRPPKSFEVVVQGGETQAIGDTIWNYQPAGIQSFGNIAVSVTDSQGNAQEVWFSKPINLYLWLKVSYSVYNEEVFPTDGAAQMGAAILAWAASEYTLGKDVIPGRIAVPVYSVQGIDQISVLVAVTAHPSDTPTYTADRIPVGPRNAVLADTTRMEFTRTA